MTVDAVLLGGGIGRRFSDRASSLPKQFQVVEDAPVFIHTLRVFQKIKGLRKFIVVMPEEYLARTRETIREYFGDDHSISVMAGGERRQDSARLALQAMSDDVPDRVLIHDLCRPCLSPAFLRRIAEHTNDRAYAAWIPVVPVVETLKRVEGNRVAETVDRSLVHRVQTPQIFHYPTILELSVKSLDESSINFTDDASLCEYYGVPVGVFEGDLRNLKLTYDFELGALTSWLKEPQCE